MAGAPQRTASAARNGHGAGGVTGAPPAGTDDPRADGDVRDPSAQADSLRSVAGRMLRGLAAQVQRRVPPADLDERDPDYIRETLPRMWLLASLYFRGEVRGLGNVPDEGPVLLVGNHSGGNLTPDTTVFSLAFHAYFGVERPFHQLAHNLVLVDAGPRLPAQVRDGRRLAGERAHGAAQRRRGARLPRRRPRGPPALVAERARRLRRPQGLRPARAGGGRADRARRRDRRPGDRALPVPGRVAGQVVAVGQAACG